jgi:hypothetical protein
MSQVILFETCRAALGVVVVFGSKLMIHLMHDEHPLVRFVLAALDPRPVLKLSLAGGAHENLDAHEYASIKTSAPIKAYATTVSMLNMQLSGLSNPCASLFA